MSLSISRTLSGTGAACALLSTDAPDDDETRVTLLATLVPFSSAGPAVTRARAPGASDPGRTAPWPYVNSIDCHRCARPKYFGSRSPPYLLPRRDWQLAKTKRRPGIGLELRSTWRQIERSKPELGRACLSFPAGPLTRTNPGELQMLKD